MLNYWTTREVLSLYLCIVCKENKILHTYPPPIPQPAPGTDFCLFGTISLPLTLMEVGWPSPLPPPPVAFEGRSWRLGASQVALVVKNPPVSAGDVRDVGLIPGSGRSPGGGNGNPFHYSCLQNPMDRGAWQATDHRVVKSWTQLNRLSLQAILSSKALPALNTPRYRSPNTWRFLHHGTSRVTL